MVHVPYKGGGPATAALIAGEVQVMMSSPAPILQYIHSGRVRALAYTGAARASYLPDVPTVAEAGLPGFQFDGGWFGLFAPANTPADIVERLSRETRTALAEPQTAARLRALGLEPVGDSPAEFKQFFAAEMGKYAEWVRIANIEPE